MWNSGWILWGVVAVLELCLTWTWSPPYFRYGVPVFLYRLKLPSPLSRLPSPESLRPHLCGELRSVRFGVLSPVELAFNGQPYVMTNLGPMVMHGMVRLGPSGQTVVMRGLLNWSLPLVFLPLLMLTSQSGTFATVICGVFFSGLLGFVYLAQMDLCKRLGAFIVEQVSTGASQ